mgnify:CR=1 FL=1
MRVKIENIADIQSGLYLKTEPDGDVIYLQIKDFDSNGRLIFNPEPLIKDNGKLSNNTYIANIINKYKNKFGKSRVVVIKSQLGQPITAYSGDKVYWTVPKKLPKMTKLMIDGKALYIHRANYQIIDTSLLN